MTKLQINLKVQGFITRFFFKKTKRELTCYFAENIGL